MNKKILIRIVAFSLSACALFYPISIRSDALSVNAGAAVLIDSANGNILYEKNAHASLPMASTTKIMTALVALEYLEPDEKITVSADAVGIEGTSACLDAGEIYTLKELLFAMLLQSANDAAAAIAIGVAGSVEGFSVLMNYKARTMGLSGSSFKNPHGLPDSEHYTTAYELALISSYAMQNECIKEITSSKRASITSEQGKTRYFNNHNKMLSAYEGADGVKTGYTKASGRCLVSSAVRADVRLIAVTLNCRDDWSEHKRMLDYGFSLVCSYNRSTKESKQKI